MRSCLSRELISPISGVHRWPADVGGAEHGYGWRTRTGDPTDRAVNFRSEWNFQGPGWNGGGAGSWHNTNMLIQPCLLNIAIMPSYWYMLPETCFRCLCGFTSFRALFLTELISTWSRPVLKQKMAWSSYRRSIQICLHVFLQIRFYESLRFIRSQNNLQKFFPNLWLFNVAPATDVEKESSSCYGVPIWACWTPRNENIA